MKILELFQIRNTPEHADRLLVCPSVSLPNRKVSRCNPLPVAKINITPAKWLKMIRNGQRTRLKHLHGYSTKAVNTFAFRVICSLLIKHNT